MCYLVLWLSPRQRFAITEEAASGATVGQGCSPYDSGSTLGDWATTSAAHVGHDPNQSILRLRGCEHHEVHQLGCGANYSGQLWLLDMPADQLPAAPVILFQMKTSTIWAARLFRNNGKNAWHVRHGPNRLVLIASITVPSITAFSAVSHVS